MAATSGCTRHIVSISYDPHGAAPHGDTCEWRLVGDASVSQLLLDASGILLVGEGNLSFFAALAWLRGSAHGLIATRQHVERDGALVALPDAPTMRARARTNIAAVRQFLDPALDVPEATRPTWAASAAACCPLVAQAEALIAQLRPAIAAVPVAALDARSEADLRCLGAGCTCFWFQCPHAGSQRGTERLVAAFFAAAAAVQAPGDLLAIGMLVSRKLSTHYGLLALGEAGHPVAFCSPSPAYEFVGCDALLPLRLLAAGYEHVSCSAARGTALRAFNAGKHLVAVYRRC